MNNFSDITGHADIIKSLNESMEKNRVSHAYIFSGKKGSGKKMTANAFAKALQCENGIGQSCGICKSCHSFDSGNNPDVYYVYPSKTKTLSVDDIREQIIERVKTKQYSFRYKIFIVDEADKMTPQAQNALLKTLEEPPEYVIIILIAENAESFLPTVLSRCVVLRFMPIGNDDIKRFLIEKKNMSEADAAFYAEYSMGSIGNALLLSEDENFSAMRHELYEKLISIPKMSLTSVMAMGRSLDKFKDYSELTDMIFMWYRDVFAAKYFDDVRYIIEKDMKDDIFSLAAKYSFESLEKITDAVKKAKKYLSFNTNFQLAMEILFMEIKES
jgi:DNA polymerase-3 subunit delta'